ncbi:hypothetical protein [Streptomyces sp. NPDC057257]|uniref:hypothetical protein n=1 Tax=Streptomyces sp. NPDC057257 TaxID=3346071 RepID=UPI00363E00E7
MSLTDAKIRETLRPHAGRFGSPIARLCNTGEITEQTHSALRDRAIELELDGRDNDADQLRDAAEYVLDVGCRPPVEGWTTRH